MTDKNKNSKSQIIEQSLLKELEDKRIKTEKKSSIFTTTTLLFLVGVFFYKLTRANNFDEVFGSLFLIGFFGFFVYFIGKSIITSSYIDKFKLEIIKPLIEGMNETFIYKPERKVPRFIFKKSKLFGMFNVYDGDDFVSGEIDGVKFSLSELSVYHERKSGKNRVVVKIFSGIFGEFDFNKNFSSTLLIYPDVAEKYFGHFGQWLQSINMTKDQLIKLDNPEFEKHFVVYGSDQIEARYLLTYSMMEYILELRKKVNVPIYISFNESKLYIGFEYDGLEQFEPDISASLLDNSYIQGHIEKIRHHIEIVENFKLNKYLWSKQPIDKSKAELKQPIQTKIIENIESKEHNEDIQKKTIEPSETRENPKDIYSKYYQQVSEILKPLEKERISTLVFQIVFTIVVSTIYIMLGFYLDEHARVDIGAIIGIGVFVYVGILFGIYSIESRYQNNYKKKLVNTLFKNMNSDLSYEPNNRIIQDDLYKALLFKDWSSFSGDDLIKGTMAGLNVLGSELNISVDKRDAFQGYFFIFDLKNYEKLDLRIFPKFREFDVTDSDVITMMDEDFTDDSKYFKNVFSAYGNNDDAKKLLSKEFISKLMFFYRELRASEIYISFRESKLYIGFNLNDELFFEAKTTKSVYDEDKFLFYISFFNAVEELMGCIKPQK